MNVLFIATVLLLTAEDKTPEELAKEWMLMQVGDWESASYHANQGELPISSLNFDTRNSVRMRGNVLITRSWKQSSSELASKSELAAKTVLSVAFWVPDSESVWSISRTGESTAKEFDAFVRQHGELFWDAPHLYREKTRRVFSNYADLIKILPDGSHKIVSPVQVTTSKPEKVEEGCFRSLLTVHDFGAKLVIVKRKVKEEGETGSGTKGAKEGTLLQPRK